MDRTDRAHGELTSAQRQIWVGQKLAPGVPLYNIPFTFRLRGALDRSRFAEAYRQSVAASDALCTVFAELRERPSRVVKSAVEVALERIDLSADPVPESTARSLIAERARRVFDLSSPLVDSMLIQLGPEDHLWFVNQHHLITDAWSTALFFRQVETRYRALAAGRAVAPPPPFEEHAADERRRRTENRSRLIDDGDGRGTHRPERAGDLYGGDNPSGSTASERLSLDLGGGRSRRLREIVAEPGVRGLTPEISLFNVFATVTAALLFRATRDGGGVLGTPVLNRLSPRLQETLGLFIELQPFAAGVGVEDTFEDVFARVQLETSRLLLGTPAPSAARRGFNVVLNYLTVSFPSFDGCPVEVEWWDPGHCDASHHLRIQVHDFAADGGLSVLFDFNREVFPEGRRAWVLHHFTRLLDSFLEDRTRPVAGVDLAHPEERALQVGERSDPSADRLETSLTAAFARVAGHHSEAPAVAAADSVLSYAELDARSTDVARRLLRAGVRPGDRVGLAAERHTATLCGLLGILKARAAYLPIAPGHPASRTAFVLADAGVEMIVAAAPMVGWDGRRIDPTAALEDPARPEPALEPAAADDLAYVLYTSGSTGHPKGVLIEHRQVLNLVHGLERRVYRGESPGSRVALLAPFAFDASVQQIFAALLLGHELVLVPEDTRLDGGALLAFYHRHEIDFSDGTPAHLSLLARAQGSLDSARVRHFLVGGEELRPAVLKEFYGRFPVSDPVVTNVYGPTECCVDSTSFRITRRDLDGLGARVPIGRPMPGERIYVMSGSALQPLGVPGELCIAGPGVGRGYQGRREGSPAFGEDPFFAGQRLYRTGDYGRYRMNGDIEFLGRRDSQVKVRGYRIELAEVRRALESFARPFHQPMVAGPVAGPVRRCNRCVLGAGYPGIRFDDEGVCDRCREFESYRSAADSYFRPLEELRRLLDSARHGGSGPDCLLLYSGGKDSSYVLHRLVEMGLEVLAFTFDNGFISAAAFDNIRRQTSRLGVESIVAKTSRMDAIFIESLTHDQTVCSGCFKALTTISTRLAAERGIRPILTGLSRGQIFETKIDGLFRSGVTEVGAVEAELKSFRKLYHAQEDRTSELLDDSVDGIDLDAHEFIDFFRYDSTSVPEIKAYLAQRDRFWSQPSDTGFCSSNCMMNDIGICVHSSERGYHNYEAPLSWDVRLGILDRQAALAEVESPIDVSRVNKVLTKIGYLSKTLDEVAVVVREDAPSGGAALCAYFTSRHEIGVAELRTHLAETLPEYMIPQHFVQLPALPLTANGKVDTAALPSPVTVPLTAPEETSAPMSESEEYIAAVWSEVLNHPIADVGRSFFEYGGASLQAMDVMARICDTFDIDLSLQELFEAPTVRQLAARVDRAVALDIVEPGDDPHAGRSGQLA